MTPRDFQIAMACHAAWLEEGANGLNGMLGVLFVFRNRAEAGWHGGDWGRIVEYHDFNRYFSLPNDYPDAREHSFQQLLQFADLIHDGTMPDNLTNGAKYFCDLAGYVGEWTMREIVQKPDEHPRVARIGSTDYYK